ncbi:MAG: hypothetical protein M1331_00090 [Candidatus Marsarchaeota archaeon]|nr:hypothetical protein [Candidatus Marsarchaeota archaeon]MCL5105787.1 hypothetical protein [Candidatus Marsarchaeota archaeon]
MPDANDLLIFKNRNIGNEVNKKKEESAGSAEAENKAKKTGGGTKANKEKETYSTFANESAAAGSSSKYCFNHPWRYAYAICDICKKPFCFEDIVEYKHKHYCSSDIDKVSKTVYETNFIEYSNLSYVSIISFFLTFFVFSYYANEEIISIVDKIIAKQILLPGLFNMTYVFLAGSCALVFLQVVAAFLVLIRVKKSYMLSIGTSILSILLFMYIYLNSNASYYIYIVGTTFLAFITLLVSAKMYKRVDIKNENENAVDESSKFSNWMDVRTF